MSLFSFFMAFSLSPDISAHTRNRLPPPTLPTPRWPDPTRSRQIWPYGSWLPVGLRFYTYTGGLSLRRSQIFTLGFSYSLTHSSYFLFLFGFFFWIRVSYVMLSLLVLLHFWIFDCNTKYKIQFFPFRPIITA